MTQDELNNIWAQSLKSAKNRLSLDDPKAIACYDAINRIIEDGGKKEDISLREIDTLLCSPIKWSVEKFRRNSPFSAAVVELIWQDAQDVLQFQVQKNKGIQSLQISSIKSWTQIQNRSYYLSFLDSFSETHFKSGLVSHDTVIALWLLIEDFEIKLSQSVATWLDENITQQLTKNDLLSVINDFINNYRYYSDLLPFNTDKLFIEKVWGKMMQKLELDESIPDNRWQISYMFKHASDTEEISSLSYDEISESLLMEIILEDSREIPEKEIEIMEEIVSELESTGISKENAYEAALLQIAKKIYAWIQDLVDTSILEELIENTYFKPVKAAEKKQTSTRTELLPAESRKVKYTKKAIERLYENKLAADQKIIDFTQMLHDPELEGFIAEGIQSMETFQQQHTSFINKYPSLSSWEEINAAMSDFLSMYNYSSIPEMVLDLGLNEEESSIKSPPQIAETKRFQKVLMKQYKEKRRKFAQISSIAEKYRNEIDEWISSASEMVNIPSKRLKKDWSKINSDLNTIPYLKGKLDESEQSQLLEVQELDELIHKKEALISYFNDVKSQLWDFQDAIAEQIENEKQIKEILSKAINKIAKNTDKSDGRIFLKELYELCWADFLSLENFMQALQGDALKNLVKFIMRSPSLRNKQYLKLDSTITRASDFPLPDNIDEQELESLGEILETSARRMKTSSWNIFILWEILNIETPEIKELSRSVLPVELQSMQRDNSRDIQNFLR